MRGKNTLFAEAILSTNMDFFRGFEENVKKYNSEQFKLQRRQGVCQCRISLALLISSYTRDKYWL